MTVIELAACPQCGARFHKTRAWHKFCNDVCKQRWHHEQREKLLRVAREHALTMDPHSWERFSQKE
jgi:hypothetical protein